jgi:hypothetical protein
MFTPQRLHLQNGKEVLSVKISKDGSFIALVLNQRALSIVIRRERTQRWWTLRYTPLRFVRISG